MENTGLRHRKIKTIAAKSMADELSQLAAKSGGGSGDGGHRPQPSTIDSVYNRPDGGGGDNLFAGVEFLPQQNSRDDDNGSKQRRDH